ncbi:aminotransferase class I/II-fold pyridoxal phosphate-dependent enzyme [candidate division KSB1 bacterium]|nr:aminotransferase class I/II-fold pyridoxal phosphate-dependent enzyme [candidate division KSB1 bacterium]
MKLEKLKKLHLATRMVRAATDADFSRVKSHVPPIFQTVNFDYKDAEEGLAIFRGEKEGYIYSRNGNPTTDLLAQVIALLEESEAALVTASGMAAVSSVFLGLTAPGDAVVSSAAIYGGTRAFLQKHLSIHGVQTRFVDITDLDAVESAIDSHTRILYTEVVGNPNLVVADIAALVELAHRRDLFLVVDNTFTPPPLFQPLIMGADVVLHSATKYLGGHGDLLGGAIATKRRWIDPMAEIVKHYGAILSPFNAWLALRGIKTLELRVQRQCENAHALAHFLSKHPAVSRVYYPGMADHPQHDVARRQLQAFGGILAFEMKKGFEAAKRVMDSVQVCSFTTSLGEIDSLIIHPASTSHIALSVEERAAIGVTDSLIRFSVGIENLEDLQQDLDQALNEADRITP